MDIASVYFLILGLFNLPILNSLLIDLPINLPFGITFIIFSLVFYCFSCLSSAEIYSIKYVGTEAIKDLKFQDDEPSKFIEKSKVLLVSGILGVLYSIFLITYFYGINNNSDGITDILAGAIATTLVLPHIILIVLATLFNITAFLLNSKGFTITSAALYTVAGVVFILYIYFVIPMIILSFIGISSVSKINAKKFVNY